ncbi:Histone H3-like centromeric protein cpar-1 (CENP-A-related protein 1) (Centromeric protein A related) [Durusdinium trenchii]|uniref:Histone H3-like centromeric protein cpar-1 (CENP-A-related protein 1) (Centromeric protein A related) n=1 Tax=Durusdinium trenchii TaxID=1381693 RepID=A0ABP0QNA8_9DINO
MGSVILALSLDYSLFLLSRFSENHNDKLTLQENVDIIKACTCRTIAVSGVLVAIAFFSGILLPERNLQGTCICLGFAVLACVATNVVFLPAVFVVFGPMLVGNSFLPTWWGDVELAADLADEEERSQRPEADNANWLVIMRVVERAPVAAIALVVLFVWPILSSAPSLHITADRFAMMPLWSPAVLALRNIQDAHFPTGLMSPYEILVTAPDQPDDLVISNEIRSSLEPLGRPELKDLVEKMGLGDLRNALKEGLAGTTTERPGGWPGFVELMRGVTCAQNHTESTPQHPHCSCCPNAFLDCRECDFMDKCESPEMQAALKQFSSGNVSLDEEHLRMLKDCALRAQALDFKASHLKTVGDQLMSSPLEGANLTAPVLDKTILERFPFLVEVVHQVQSLSHKDRGMLLLPSGFAALLELCEDLYRTGGVASMLGPSWLYHQRLDWVFAVGLAVKPELRDGYNLFLQQFAEGKHALLQAYARMTSNRIEDLTFLAGEPETEIPMTSTVGQLAKAQTGWICIRALTRRETVEKKLKDYLREKAGFFDESEQMVSLAEEQWAQLVGEQSHMSVQALCSWVGDLVKECVSVCHVTGSKEFSMADCLHVLDKGDMVLRLSREEEVSNGSTRRLVRVLKEPVDVQSSEPEPPQAAEAELPAVISAKDLIEADQAIDEALDLGDSPVPLDGRGGAFGDGGRPKAAAKAAAKKTPRRSKRVRVTVPRKQRSPPRVDRLGQRQKTILREIARLQSDKAPPILLPKAAFGRLVREALDKVSEEEGKHKMTSEALTVLQESTEWFMSDLFADAQKCVVHRKKATLTPDDLTLVQLLQKSKPRSAGASALRGLGVFVVAAAEPFGSVPEIFVLQKRFGQM